MKKQKKNIEFECNIETMNNKEVDEWGAAFIWIDNRKGAEYNFCVQDNGENCSAIYKMEADDNGVMRVDHDTCVHYEIDFCKNNWEEELKLAMENAVRRFFK